MPRHKQEKNVKTNAMRILDDHHLAYQVHSFEMEDAVDGMSVATLLQEDPQQVFKTLVTVNPKKKDEHFVFMIPVNQHMSLKKAARAAGVKNLEMLPLKELFPLTGYVHGGCSPLGMKKVYPTFMDETAILFDRVFFSGGKIGVQIEASPSVLENLIPFAMADLCEE